jgi:hypothetical protein
MLFNIWGGGQRRRTLTPGDKSYLLRAARGKCEYCGGDIVAKGVVADIHHIVPFASRGSDSYHNLIVLCPNCHSKVDSISKEALRKKIAYRLRPSEPAGMKTEGKTVRKPAAKAKGVTVKAVKKATVSTRTKAKSGTTKAATRKSAPVKSSRAIASSKRTVTKKTAAAKKR